MSESTQLGRLATLRAGLRSSWRILLKEVAAFGAVGAVGFVIDVGLFNLFFHEGQAVAKLISTSVATVATYLGNRYFSFSHRARSGVGRETSIFFGINMLVLGFSIGVIALAEYPMHFKHHVFAMNVANIVSIAMGTGFRFWAYKRFVFMHPDKVHDRLSSTELESELTE